jgi:hypothetical protein
LWHARSVRSATMNPPPSRRDSEFSRLIRVLGFLGGRTSWVRKTRQERPGVFRGQSHSPMRPPSRQRARSVSPLVFLGVSAPRR